MRKDAAAKQLEHDVKVSQVDGDGSGDDDVAAEPAGDDRSGDAAPETGNSGSDDATGVDVSDVKVVTSDAGGTSAVVEGPDVSTGTFPVVTGTTAATSTTAAESSS